MFLYCPLYTCGISIALAIRSVNPRWGLDVQGFRCIYTPASGAFKGWCAVRTLQIVLFKQGLKGVAAFRSFLVSTFP